METGYLKLGNKNHFRIKKVRKDHQEHQVH